jgi:hypothetical protein
MQASLLILRRSRIWGFYQTVATYFRNLCTGPWIAEAPQDWDI